MKNNNLFLLIAAVFALISCGTANRSAQYNGTRFRNSIYYTPDNKNSLAYGQEQKYLQELQERTSDAAESYSTRESRRAAADDTMTVYVGDNSEVDIQYAPGTTYSIVDDQESYEARLRKFDSPYYTINIEFNDPYPWMDFTYGWYTPFRGRWYPNWSHPWYSSTYAWYGPAWDWHYGVGWYNPWHYAPYWSWRDPFFDPWWGYASWPGYWPGYWYGHYHWPGYWPGHHPGHHPGYHPGYGPGARPDHHRDVYYGKRNSTPSYRDNNRNSGTVANGNATGRPNTGSVTRRPANVTPINSNNGQHSANVSAGNRNERPQNAVQQGSGNQYRRVVPGQGSKGNANVSTGNAPKKNGSTYNRTSSSQTRSSYSSGNSSQSRSSSSYSSGSSSQSRSSYSSGSRSTGSSSSGSSYRRR